MLTEKQSNFIFTIIFLIPITAIFSIFTNLYLQQRCKEFGSFWGVETQNRFFSSCQFKDKKGEWQPLKKFVPFEYKNQKLSTGYPQVVIDKIF